MIKERNEIDSAYMWDLTPLFKSDEEWEKELDSFDEKVSALVKYQGTLKDAKTIHGFYEELTDHKSAQAIADEIGGTTLLLHSCHNVSAEDFKNGATYVSLMKQNIENLKTGLGEN